MPMIAVLAHAATVWPEQAHHETVRTTNAACFIRVGKMKIAFGREETLVCVARLHQSRVTRSFIGWLSDDQTWDSSIAREGPGFAVTNWMAMDTGQAKTMAVRISVGHGGAYARDLVYEGPDEAGQYQFRERFELDFVHGIAVMRNTDCAGDFEVFRKKISAKPVPLPKAMIDLLTIYRLDIDQNAFRCPEERKAKAR